MEEREIARKLRRAARKPKQLPMPWEFWSITPIAITYGIARFYILIETFMGLRSLEKSAYFILEWSDYLPHI